MVRFFEKNEYNGIVRDCSSTSGTPFFKDSSSNGLYPDADFTACNSITGDQRNNGRTTVRNAGNINYLRAITPFSFNFSNFAPNM